MRAETTCRECARPATHAGLCQVCLEDHSPGLAQRIVRGLTTIWNEEVPELLDELLDAAGAAADCRRRTVGAVLVKGLRVVGVGWNGLPEGSCLGGECPRGLKTYAEAPAFGSYSDCVAVHAEGRALEHAGPEAAGAVMVVSAEPCSHCRRAMTLAGVVAVHVVTRPHSNAEPAPVPR